MVYISNTLYSRTHWASTLATNCLLAERNLQDVKYILLSNETHLSQWILEFQIKTCLKEREREKEKERKKEELGRQHQGSGLAVLEKQESMRWRRCRNLWRKRRPKEFRKSKHRCLIINGLTQGTNHEWKKSSFIFSEKNGQEIIRSARGM